MYEIMSADEAIRLIRDGDCICVNSFVGIENPVELHEAIYRRYQRMQSPSHLTIVSSAGFGVWDEEHNAEGYIREGAVDKLICGHFGAMLSTKKLVLEDYFEAYNLPLGCISHAIRAQASGLPGALSKVGLDIFVDPRKEGRASTESRLTTHWSSMWKWMEKSSYTISCPNLRWRSSRGRQPIARGIFPLTICSCPAMRCPFARP